MTDAGNILNEDDFLGDIVQTPKEGTEQHRKQECLKSAIDRGKANLLGSKWTQERVDNAQHKQCELNKKGEKTAKALGKHVIKLYSDGLSK